jgi:hypothetical protein
MLPEVVLERRLHLTNIGQRDSRQQYLHVLKAALDRRNANESSASPDPAALARGDQEL